MDWSDLALQTYDLYDRVLNGLPYCSGKDAKKMRELLRAVSLPLTADDSVNYWVKEINSRLNQTRQLLSM